MAIVTRRYVQTGPTAELEENVVAGAMVVGFAGGVVDVQFDDAVAGTTTTLDEYLASMGYTFLVAAPPVETSLLVRSPDGSLHAIGILDDGSLLVDGAAATGLEYAEWRVNGALTVVSAIDTAWLGRPGQAYAIVGVQVYRATAGLLGQTRINLAVGTSGGAAVDLYSAGARPTITALAGNFVHLVAALPDLSTAVPAGARLELDIEEVETGVPSDLSVRVLLSPV